MSTGAAAASYERDQLVNKLKDGSLGFVGDVVKFSGEVHFRSMLRIDGKFSGQIKSSDGTLIVSSGARVTGAVIDVAVARINGAVEGDVNASQELVLGPTAVVDGRLSAGSLHVEEGAIFNGSCRRIQGPEGTRGEVTGTVAGGTTPKYTAA
jgi:cytoskeletal protein CcmA (bactofilin family)